jgi:hypothetical protein
MQLNRRRFLLGGFAASAFAAGSGNAQVMTSGGKVLTSGGQVITAPPVPAPPAGGLLNTQIVLTNPSGQPTQTNPFVSFGMPIARSEYPANGYKLALYDAAGSSKITDLQVDMQASGWQPDGSRNYAVVTGYATGTTLTAGSSGTFTLRAEAGSSPTTPVCTLAQLAANSDIKAKVVIGTDAFTVSVNDIITNFSGAPGSYPLGKIWTWKSGPYACEWCFGRYLKRDSDGASHKWVFVKLYVTALSANGPYIVRGKIENPNLYGANPNGTVGPTGGSPFILMESVDVYNGAARIGSIGGANDPNNATFSPSNVNLSTGEIAATISSGLSFTGGLYNSRTPCKFTSTGTLPAGIDPTATYWLTYNSGDGAFILALNRTHSTGLLAVYSRIATPVAGKAVAFRNWIFANGAAYLCTTAGTSTGALPTGDTFADNSAGGTLVWKRISERITSQGTGTHTAVLKSAVTTGSKVPLMAPDTYPYWSGAGTLPKLLVGYDRNYVFGQTFCFPPLDPSIVCAPWIGNLPCYIQHNSYLPGQTSIYYIGNVSESPVDERINQASPTAMASICLPTDVGMARSCRAMALSWVDRNVAWRDERIQEIPVVSYGPDRLGSSYPGMAPNNPTIVIGVANNTAGTGNPKFNGYDGADTGYGGTLGGSNSPDGGHSPNPCYWPALTSGDPFFMDDLIESASLQIGFLGGGQVIRSAAFNGKTLTWAWPFMTQTRSSGHAFQIFCQASWIIPDAHAAHDYFADVMDDSAAIGPLWAAAKVGPNGQSVGYIPFIYPQGPWQAQETWMMGYLHMAFMCEILKNNRPGFKSFYTSYFYKSLLPLFDSDVGGDEHLIELQWDMIGNNTSLADPPLDSQFLLTVPDRLTGNPVVFKRLTQVPPALDLFPDESIDQGVLPYRYRQPGGATGGGTFPGNAYGLTQRSVVEMGAMWGFAYATKIADRIQAVIDRAYAGNACNWSNQATVGNPNGLMYAMKRQ